MKDSEILQAFHTKMFRSDEDPEARKEVLQWQKASSLSAEGLKDGAGGIIPQQGHFGFISLSKQTGEVDIYGMEQRFNVASYAVR